MGIHGRWGGSDVFILTIDLSAADVWLSGLLDARFRTLVDYLGTHVSWLYVLHAGLSKLLDREDEAEEYLQNLLEVLIDNCPLEVYNTLDIEDNETMYSFHEFLYNSYMDIAVWLKGVVLRQGIQYWETYGNLDYEILFDASGLYVVKIFKVYE